MHTWRNNLGSQVRESRAGLGDSDSVLVSKYEVWIPYDSALPDGRTDKGVDAAKQLVLDVKRSDEPYVTPLVIELCLLLESDAGEPRQM